VASNAGGQGKPPMLAEITNKALFPGVDVKLMASAHHPRSRATHGGTGRPALASRAAALAGDYW
jgi:hypothetical protein